ncbi:hypothetical protein PIB30_068890 [Stylosanthes scabra]|nr:hypothetical protein [Stylosanthes scabra]
MKNISSSISSPWQRMKWTDTMVRLLIMAVYYIGDEGGGAGGSSNGGGGSSEASADPNAKKKMMMNKGQQQQGGGLILQNKKGKWKSVSRAMMEKGFYVSPQQCEDKFNDLNKRYKRVNDVLGRGTACKVVENHKLLDTMDHLSPKAKEEVKKLLNSKHLFFREMCAYHNSCGHGSGGVGDVSHQSQFQQEKEEKEIGCEEEEHHHDDSDDDDYDDEENDDEVSEDYFDEDEDELGEGGSKGRHHHLGHHHHDSKRQKKSSSSSCELMMKELSNEVNGVLEDKGKSVLEKKQWLKNKIVKLEEKQIRYEGEGFEIEKQRLKWRKYSSKKEREMERSKLDNEKRRLENQRMILIIHQKELELKHQQH